MTRRRQPRFGRRVFALAFTALCVAYAIPGVAAAELIDRILAVVGGEVITQSDATAAIDFGLVTVAPNDDPIGSVLPLLIDRQLILAEVDRYAPAEPSSEAIEQRLQRMQTRFPSTQAYTAALDRSGLDEARLRRVLRDQLRIEAYLDQRFTTDRADSVVAEWVTSLRRRSEITYLYVPRR
jgi:hypothetical protein